MELKHKIFQLINAKGEDVVIEDINSLFILVEGLNFNIPVVPQQEGDLEFVTDAAVWKSGFEAYSIFEKFGLDAAGYLVNEGVHISFFDTATKVELLVKEISDPPLLMSKFDTDIDADQINKLTSTLKIYYDKAVLEMEAEAEKENKKEAVVIVPATLEVPEKTEEEIKAEKEKTEFAVNTTQSPATETPVTETPATETPAVPVEDKKEEVAPVSTSPVEQPVIDQTAKELEEDVIPQEVLDKYEGFKKILVDAGYTEYAYKNYRLFYQEVKEGELFEGQPVIPYSKIYLLILSPTGVLEQKRLLLDGEEDGVVKYKFKLNDDPKERRSIYLNLLKNEMVVKKPKKKEEVEK